MSFNPEQQPDSIDEEFRELVEAEENTGELMLARLPELIRSAHLNQSLPREGADNSQPQIPQQDTPRRWSNW
jgi:hypothetical protein